MDLSTDKVICSFPDNILPFELDSDNLKGYYYHNNIPKNKIEHINDRFKYPKIGKFEKKG